MYKNYQITAFADCRNCGAHFQTTWKFQKPATQHRQLILQEVLVAAKTQVLHNCYESTDLFGVGDLISVEIKELPDDEKI